MRGERISVIALTTFRELVRSKTLYTVGFFAVAMIAFSSIFGRVTIGDYGKVVRDFGLLSVSLFSTAFAVIGGASLLHKELSRKTIYNVLSKGVYRTEFILGKCLGMIMTGVLLVSMMGTALSLYLVFIERHFSVSMLYGYLFISMELIIVCSATLFFSSIVVTPLLSGLFAFGIFLAGRSTHHLVTFAKGYESRVAEAVSYLLPRLDLLNISNEVVYDELPKITTIFWSLLYTFTYSLILLVIGATFFKRRDFN